MAIKKVKQPKESPGYGTAIREPERYPDYLKSFVEVSENGKLTAEQLPTWYADLYKTGVVIPKKTKKITSESISKDSKRAIAQLTQNLVLSKTKTKAGYYYTLTEEGNLVLNKNPRGYFIIAQRKPVFRKALEILQSLQEISPKEAYLNKHDLVIVEAAPWFCEIDEIVSDIISLHTGKITLKDILKEKSDFYKLKTSETAKNPLLNILNYADTSFRMLRQTGAVVDNFGSLILNPEKQNWIEELLQTEVNILVYEPEESQITIFKPSKKNYYTTAKDSSGNNVFIKNNASSKRLGESARKNNRAAIESSKQKNGEFGEILFCLEEQASGNSPVRTSIEFEGKEDVISAGKKYEIKTTKGPISTIDSSASQLKRIENGSLDYFVVYSNENKYKTTISSKDFKDLLDKGLIKVVYKDIEFVFEEGCREYIENNTIEVDPELVSKAKSLAEVSKDGEYVGE